MTKRTLDEDEQKILEIIRENPGSTGPEIRKLLGNKMSVGYILSFLIRNSFIRKELSFKSRFPRYYLIN